MKNYLFLLVFGVTLNVTSQVEDAWVYFKDKPNSNIFFNNPLSELSQRSLDRRQIQSIPLDMKDAPIHQIYVDQIENSAGITVLAKSKWLNCVHVQGLYSDLNNLVDLNFVDHIQFANHSLNPNGKLSSKSIQVSITNKWNYYNENQVQLNYGVSATQVQMLNCDKLHLNDFTGSGKVVAIMDAGFPGVDTALPFKRLRDNNLILGGYNFVSNSDNYYVANSHGTNVLSTMGGFLDGQLIGTAPDAKYYLFITEDVASETPLEESNWIEAAEEADRKGVDVINTSLGYFGYDNPNYSYDYSQMNGEVSVMSRAVDIAFSRGMICVTSAGNSGASNEPHISAPADAKFNVTVGSVDASRAKSGFSSIGPSFDGRVKPDIMAMGTSSIIATTNGNITAANGTSFSSPIMAGAIASLWSAYPTKTNIEIVEMVKSSADRFLNPTNEYGFGIPDFGKLIETPQTDFNSISIFPNPANEYIEINVPERFINTKIFLFNTLGMNQKIVELNNQKIKINISDLQSGMYFYTLESDNKIKGKIIKF